MVASAARSTIETGDDPGPGVRRELDVPGALEDHLTRSVADVTVCNKNALAHTPGELAADTDAAPGRCLAEAQANGGGQAEGRGLDPAGDARDDRALPVARPGDPVVPGRSDADARRPDRHDDG